MKGKILLILVIIFFSTNLLHAECPWKLKNIYIRSSVSFDDSTGLFYYHIFVKNSNKPPPRRYNEVSFFDLIIPFKEGKYPLPPPPIEEAPGKNFVKGKDAYDSYCVPVSVVSPVSWNGKNECISRGLSDCDSYPQDWSYDVGYWLSKVEGIGPGCFLGWSPNASLPPGLVGDFDLQPQQSVTFVIASYGLPAITQFEVESAPITYFDFFYEENNLEDATGDEVYAFMKSQGCSEAELKDDAYTRIITAVLGPDSLEYPFNITNFVAKIHDNYFNSAVMYGWIKCEPGFTGGFHAPPAFKPMKACIDPYCPPENTGTPCGDMEGYLLDAYQGVKSGDFSSASEKLSSAMDLLESMGCDNYSNCTTDTVFQSEAYGLLYYNIGFAEDYLESGGGAPTPPFFKGRKWRERGKIEEKKPIKPPKKLTPQKRTNEESSSGGCHGFWCWLEEFIREILRWMGFLR